MTLQQQTALAQQMFPRAWADGSANRTGKNRRNFLYRLRKRAVALFYSDQEQSNAAS